MRSVRAYLVVFALALALPLAVLSLVQSFEAARLHHSAIERALLDTTRALAAAVQQELDSGLAVLHALAASTHLDRSDLRAFDEEGRRVKATQPWHTIWLADASGRQLVNVTRAYGSALPAVSERECFMRVVRTQRAVVSSVQKPKVAPDRRICIAVPVVRDAKLRYVLVATYTPTAFAELLAAQPLSAAPGAAFVIDDQRIVLARSEAAEEWLGTEGLDAAFGAIASANAGAIRVRTVSGRAVYSAYQTLPESSWSVAISLPTSHVEAGLDSAMQRTAVLATLLLLAALIGAVLVARRIARPICLLARSARDIADGREPALDHPTDIREIATLTSAMRAAGQAMQQRDRFAAELTLAFDNLREGLVTCTPSGKFIHWNAAALRIHGFASPHDVRGTLDDLRSRFELRTLDGELVPPEEWPLSRVLRGEVLRDLDLRVRRTDIQWERICSYAGALAWRARGEAMLALVTISDITTRRQAELALRASEEHFRLLVEQMVEGLVLTDRDGRILDANSAACEMLGCTRDDCIGISVEEFAADRESPHIHGVFARLRNGDTVRNEWRLKRRNGTVFYAEITARHIPDGRVQAILRDVTERRTAQAEARTRQRQLDELHQLHVASLTAAAIAHELGQPLSAVISYSEGALRLLRSASAETGQLTHALEATVAEAKRAGEVVRQLLALLNARDTPIGPVDLNETVLRAIAFLHTDEVNTVPVRLELAPALQPARANALQVEKVLANLVNNAVESVRDAQGLCSKPEVIVRTGRHEGMARVSVIDRGPGLDEDAAAKIFEPFYTTKGKGIGMGLAISRALVEAHGGKLWLERPPEGGAAFHFTLPLHP